MCDTLAAVGAATADGSVLFAKNSDREYDEAQYLELVPAKRHRSGESVRLTYVTIEQARETHSVLLSKPHWIWGAEIGANSYGLVVGNEAIFSKIEASPDPGVIGMDYLRLALERSKDVDEAIDVLTSLLREHGQGGNCGFRRKLSYHNSYILADPRGANVLETVDREWVVRPIQGHGAISNAMTIGADFALASPTLRPRAIEAGIYDDDGLPFAFDAVFQDQANAASGRFRHRRAMDLLSLRNGSLQISDMFKILRDHEEGLPLPGRSSGPRICTHTQENPLGQTTASWAASLVPGRAVHWVTGTAAPCTGLFKPVVLAAGLPAQAPPGASEDAVSLWWRHEQLRRHLDKAGQGMRDGFYEERDSLEAIFLRRMMECPEDADDGSHAEIRRVVDDCWLEGLAFEDRWHARLATTDCRSPTATETT